MRLSSNGLDQALINHVALVLDASSSMDQLTRQVVQVADGQVKELAEVSKTMDQETRATVYTFASGGSTRCIYYDKDVLRLPSLQGKYSPYGNTALIDATMKSIADLKQSATLYGDHAFLIYVLTDGQENDSRNYGPSDLKKELESLPDNWSVAALVPDERGVKFARNCGFFPGNVAVWGTNVAGIVEVGLRIQTATQSFMTQRAAGVRGSRNLFQASTAAVDPKQLKVLPKNQYTTYVVGAEQDGHAIKVFVEGASGRKYKRGDAYYQLTKKEKIQPSKDVLLLARNGDVYYGVEARQMIGIPDGVYGEVVPENHTDYTIFIRSDSVTRKLVANTLVIVRR